MGKGLSELQMKVLILAYRKGGTTYKHGSKKVYTSEIDISTEDILREVFKVKTASARASVSRVFKRLEERGLAERYYAHQVSGYLLFSGIKLTRAGRERAKALMVNTVLSENYVNG